MKICGFQAGILFILFKELGSALGLPVSGINCGDICSAVSGSPYTLTCTWSGTLVTGIIWQKDGVQVMTCNKAGTLCASSTVGYGTGTYPNSTSATLTITSFDPTTDTKLWECRDGSDLVVSCTLPQLATGSLLGQCNQTGNSYDISCSGITSHGLPAASLKLMDGNTGLTSTTSAGSVSSTQTNSAGKNYTCEVTGIAGTCLSPTSVPVTCPVSAPGTTLPPTKSPDSNVSTTAATNTTTTITSTVTENSSQSSIDIQLSVLVPVVSLVVIILIIIVVYCVVVSFRNRRAKENERNSKDQFSMNNKL